MEREQDDVGYILVDPPVGPYSTPDEIRRWIAELEQARVWLAGAAEPY